MSSLSKIFQKRKNNFHFQSVLYSIPNLLYEDNKTLKPSNNITKEEEEEEEGK